MKDGVGHKKNNWLRKEIKRDQHVVVEELFGELEKDKGLWRNLQGLGTPQNLGLL